MTVLISSPFIERLTGGSSFVFLLRKIILTVFSMFSLRLFASNHFESDKISFSIEPCLERRFVSSAKRINFPSLIERVRSLIYSKKNGPRIEPCGTSSVIYMGSVRCHETVSFKLHVISTR